MDREKDPLLLRYTYTLSIDTVDLIQHLQLYQRCELMILTMWVKSISVLWQPRYYNLLSEKSIIKFTFLKCSFFRKRTVTANLKKFCSNTIFRWFAFRKFYIVKFNYFCGRHNKVKEKFWNIFNRPLCWWYWKQKRLWKLLKTSCISLIHTVRDGSVYTGSYVFNVLVHIIYVLFICI